VSRDFVPAIYNVCATGGTSNRDIISAAQRITGKKLDLQEKPRRAGDPSRLIGSWDRLKQQGWQPEHGLDDMIQHAWNWYVR
jgi:UDP-glucose 4-epimerase